MFFTEVLLKIVILSNNMNFLPRNKTISLLDMKKINEFLAISGICKVLIDRMVNSIDKNHRKSFQCRVKTVK